MVDSPRPPAAKGAGDIAGMFDAIANRYDVLNHLLSAGLDRRWRVRAIDALKLTNRETVLDVCTGTVDLAITAVTARRGSAGRAIGLDFASEMLRLGRDKVHAAGLDRQISLVRADAAELPLVGGSVDAVMMAFGIRNVREPSRACAEAYRVLRACGRLAILEFGLPSTPALRAVYLWYFRHVLPRIGRAVSGHPRAYSYLPESVGTFPSPEAFSVLLRNVGFSRVSADPLTFGVVYLYTAVKA